MRSHAFERKVGKTFYFAVQCFGVVQFSVGKCHGRRTVRVFHQTIIPYFVHRPQFIRRINFSGRFHAVGAHQCRFGNKRDNVLRNKVAVLVHTFRQGAFKRIVMCFTTVYIVAEVRPTARRLFGKRTRTVEICNKPSHGNVGKKLTLCNAQTVATGFFVAAAPIYKRRVIA